MAPTQAKAPPVGPEWLHEVKFDGWRAQVHLRDGEMAILSKRGAVLTRVDEHKRLFDISSEHYQNITSCFLASINKNPAFVIRLPKSFDVELRECVFWLADKKDVVCLSKPEREEVSVQAPLVGFEARWLDSPEL
jgi:hypothetical protein